MGLRRLGLEAFVLAYLLRRGARGATLEELARALEAAARRGILAGGVDSARLRLELESYIEYLREIRAVEERAGRIVLRESRLSPFLRRVLEEAAELVDGVAGEQGGRAVAEAVTA